MPTIAETLAGHLDGSVGTWTPWVDRPDGSAVRAKAEPDHDGDPFDGDSMGRLVYPARGSNSRPAGVDGAGRKLQTRDGPVWWQPPADVVNDPAILESVAARVQGHLWEEWCLVGLIVERKGPPCQCCGERKQTGASVWGIESDALDYWPEVLADLVHELDTGEGR